jgi:hypothetical protein
MSHKIFEHPDSYRDIPIAMIRQLADDESDSYDQKNNKMNK